MQKFRVTLAVEAKDAEEAGAFVGTLGAPKHLQWDEPLACETLEVEFVEDLDPEAIAEREATIEAIREHIQRRREDPDFMARLDKLFEKDALVLELLKPLASTVLIGPRTCFFIVHGGGVEKQLTLHASSDPDFVAQLACEDFGGEQNGPGSLADAAFDLGEGTAGAFYSIPELDTFGIGFHSGAVPSVKILEIALGCSEEQANLLRSLVERHQDSARTADSAEPTKARTYCLVEQLGKGEVDMIPVCPECLSEDVEAPDGDKRDGWCCGNCGARFDVPVEASS